MTHHTMTPIDAHRPWIRDERDDPARMDWFQTLFNPMGMTGKWEVVKFHGITPDYMGPICSAGSMWSNPVPVRTGIILNSVFRKLKQYGLFLSAVPLICALPLLTEEENGSDPSHARAGAHRR